jgi:hypothetical protein
MCCPLQEVLIGMIQAALRVAGGRCAAMKAPLPPMILFHLDLLPLASRQEYLHAVPVPCAANCISSDQNE